ncbi:MAG: hypothetical protein ACK2UK_20165, partial [Candidatus Promineifilaceae bacterium]
MTKSTYFLLLGLLLAAFFAAGPAQPTVAAPESNAVVGNGTPASCTEANFDAALVTAHAAGGGNISFDCGGAATIEFTSEKLITNALVTINGDGKITFSGGDKVRLFQIGKTGHLLLNDITLSHGYVGYLQGGGAILNYGSVSLDNTTIRDSHTSPGY